MKKENIVTALPFSLLSRWARGVGASHWMARGFYFT
jgi:hypothetical protein